MADTSDFVPETTPQGTSDFIPEAPATTSPTPSTTEAGLRGFANSASFGLGKWVNGILGATENAYNRTGLPHGEGTLGLGGTPDTGNGFWADVTNSVEGQKAANEQSMSAHPIAYIAGAAAPALAGGVAGAATKVLPTTLGKQALLGVGLGAEGGAAESTTAKQAATNIPVGATVGGALTLVGSGVIAGISTLANKIGTKGALSALDGIIADTKSSDRATKDAAFTKLSQMADPSGSFSRDDLRVAATNFRDYINDAPNLQKNWKAEGFASPEDAALEAAKVKHDVVKSLAPPLGQVGSDLATSAIPAAAMGYGAHLGGVPGAIVGTAGALSGAKSMTALGKDATNYLAMRYAASPGWQAATSGVRQASPLAGGQIGSGVAPAVSSFGFSSMLGDYLDKNWLNKP